MAFLFGSVGPGIGIGCVGAPLPNSRLNTSCGFTCLGRKVVGPDQEMLLL